MAEKTNVLFITSDQQHYSTLGCINRKIKTPALDRLALEGVRFDRAYCNNPVCSPSRSTMITGLYPSMHHCWTIGVQLPEDVPTIGDMLQKEGYGTGLIGKAHFQPLADSPEAQSLEKQPTLRDLDFWRNFHGPYYGFQHIELARNHADEAHVGQHYAIWMEEKGLKNWKDYFRRWPGPYFQNDNLYYQGNGRSWGLPEEYHYTTWTGERSAAMLEEYARDDKPFFLWASFHDPHPPYLVPEPWASMYDPDEMEPGKLEPEELTMLPSHFSRTQEASPDYSDFDEEGGHKCHGFHSHVRDEAELRQDMACYYGMVSFMDHEIGRILDKLDELGLRENTLVVFTTDHGHFLGQHGLVAKGAFHYEDMIKVPMIARWPGKLPADRVNTDLQATIDLPETWLEAMGIEVPGVMQGKSQLGNWKGAAPARDHVLVENRHQPTRLHLRTLVEKHWKITVYRGSEEGELFDLKNDPKECNNLWDDPGHSEQKTRLLHRFVQAEMEREATRMPRVAIA